MPGNGDHARSRRQHNSNNIVNAEENDDVDGIEELNEGNIISLFKSMVDVLREKQLVGVDDDFNSFTNTRRSRILEDTELVRKPVLPKFHEESNNNIYSIGDKPIVAFQQVPMAYVPVFHDKFNEFVDTTKLPGEKVAYLVRENNKNHFYNVNNVKLNQASSFPVDNSNNFERKSQQEMSKIINQAEDNKQDYGIKINEFDEQWEMEKYPEQNDDDNMPQVKIPTPEQNRHHSIHSTGQMFGGRSMSYDTNSNTANMRNVKP